MMNMEKCLYCYKELATGEKDFHKACSKKMFGTPVVPELPYTRENLADLARQVIRSQTTLTGVQAKLSLDINKYIHRVEDFLKPVTVSFGAIFELRQIHDFNGIQPIY